MNFPFREPVTIKKLDRASLGDLLRSFEETWVGHGNEPLTSDEFYERYRAGDFDSQFGMAWTSYVEAYRRLDEASDDVSQIVESLPGALIGA